MAWIQDVKRISRQVSRKAVASKELRGGTGITLSGGTVSIDADSSPTTDSTKAVTSGGVKTALDTKMEKPSGMVSSGTYLLKNVDSAASRSQLTDFTDVLQAGSNLSYDHTTTPPTINARMATPRNPPSWRQAPQCIFCLWFF